MGEFEPAPLPGCSSLFRQGPLEHAERSDGECVEARFIAPAGRGQRPRYDRKNLKRIPLSPVAQLSRSFVCLLRLCFLPKALKCKPFVIVGKSPVGV